MLTFAVPKDTMLPNFTEKTFANSHKTAKFAKVFSLESFPLYGMCAKVLPQYHRCSEGGVNVMIMEAVKWLRRWENFLAPFLSTLSELGA